MGLLLGCSCITIVELLDLISYSFVVKGLGIGRDKKPRTNGRSHLYHPDIGIRMEPPPAHETTKTAI